MSRRFRARRFAAPVVVAGALSVAACGGGGTSAGSQPTAHLTPLLSQLVSAAQKEGELDLEYSTAGTTDEINAWQAGFNHYYGLNIKIVNTQNPVMPTNASNLIQEANSRHAADTDVYFGVSVFIDELERANVAVRGALAGLPNLQGITEDGDTTVQLADIPSGIMYNSDRIKGSQIPHKLEDVLNEPSSVLMATTPYAGTLADLPLYWGTDRAITFIAKLSHKLKGLFGCGEESRLVTGEFDMMVTDCGDSAARLLQAKGAPVASVLPSDYAFLNDWYLMIPSNARHPNAARLWINYLLSRQAQDVLWQYDATDNIHVAGSHELSLVQQDESQGIQFKDTTMDQARQAAQVAQQAACIQALLNNQFSDPSCTPWRSLIQSVS
ncbi:MAG: extracellular solute-binding protein [Candidatus Dormibacteraeota bacterium]|nr:extracellular solute-binding protein [Candidatus Dormibacteraeota bacterium]MBV9525178.1 extracellular solute-binding protein [Candidatus Dormibacteraeota bacterium]